MDNRLTALRTPFRPDQISWRIGSTTQDKAKGMALAYIDARDVQDRLDEAVGVENWQCRYPHATGKTVCEIGVRIGGEWIWKADGAGDSDVEAEKGALSDAFKRAAVRWGIGRYLYDLESPWVEIEKRGNSYIIKQDQYARLRQVAGKAGGQVHSRDPEPPNAGERALPPPTKDSRSVYVDNCIERASQFDTVEQLENWLNEDAERVWPDFGITQHDDDGRRILMACKQRRLALKQEAAA